MISIGNIKDIAFWCEWFSKNNKAGGSSFHKDNDEMGEWVVNISRAKYFGLAYIEELTLHEIIHAYTHLCHDANPTKWDCFLKMQIINH